MVNVVLVIWEAKEELKIDIKSQCDDKSNYKANDYIYYLYIYI